MPGAVENLGWALVAVVAFVECGNARPLDPEFSGAPELCEIQVADSHSPRVKFFYQHIEASGSRTYECRLFVGDVTRVESDMPAELEPWCREKIALTMSAASKCADTRFEQQANELQLSESLERGGGDGAAYLLEGRVRSYPGDG